MQKKSKINEVGINQKVINIDRKTYKYCKGNVQMRGNTFCQKNMLHLALQKL